MTDVKCKMSIFIEELDMEANTCALAMNVKCEGNRKDSGCCPFWKGVEQ